MLRLDAAEPAKAGIASLMIVTVFPDLGRISWR
jgi:hypothetical protein